MARESRKKPSRKPGGAPGWTAGGDDSFVFPAEPAPAASGRISLPSSGLASDILGRSEASLVRAEAEPEAPEAAPAGDDSSLQRVHNISFFAAPAREEKTAVEAQEHLVTFFLSGEEYGVDVRLVQEIIRVVEITQVPRAPDFIKGVINLRGRIIPVIDLKRKLGLGEVALERQTRVVVIRLRDRLVGLLVDGASQVLKVPVSTIEAAPEEVVEIDANYIRGVAKLEKRLIILVDLPKILGMDRETAMSLPT
ncbi:MAG TPA: chemotaxis protein CheW [Vicinamibacteria bacterium]|nr:chemotaxis protein CheW [Vicinamibacteria bacterium]